VILNDVVSSGESLRILISWRIWSQMRKHFRLWNKGPRSDADEKTRGRKSHETVPLFELCIHTIFIQIRIWLFNPFTHCTFDVAHLQLQSYKLAPPPQKKKMTLCKLKTILMISWGPICNLPCLLCKYSSILRVPVFSCVTCEPMAEAP
jgi:hypothetical protein